MYTPSRQVERDAVGWVGRQEGRSSAVEQPGDVVGARGVAAQQAMLAEDVQIARPDVGPVRDGRHVIGVGESLAELVELVLAGEIVEQRSERVVGRLETLEQRGELLLLGAGHRGQRIEGREDEALLVVGQLDVGDRDGRLVARQRQFDAQMAVDDVPGGPHRGWNGVTDVRPRPVGRPGRPLSPVRSQRAARSRR